MTNLHSRISRRRFVKGLGLAGAGVAMFGVESCTQPPEAPTETAPSKWLRKFNGSGDTGSGIWDAEASTTATYWKAGDTLEMQVSLLVPNTIIQSLSTMNIPVDGFSLLVTAERTFDSNGTLRLPSDEKMSTLLAPTGLAIEGGVQGAVTTRFGYKWRTPVDEFVTVTVANTTLNLDEREAKFKILTALPANIPPGIYRLRLDFGVTSKGRNFSLAGQTFAQRPSAAVMPAESHFYSMPIKASGKQPDGTMFDASPIQPKVPWVLLGAYNSNGYFGIVADEDQTGFAQSPRNIIPDDVILPLYSTDNKTILSYSLEPQFPTDTIEPRNNIPWDYTRGQLSLTVTGPDGKTVDLGNANFIAKNGNWPTTKHAPFTAWKPTAYGQYVVKASGYTVDTWGNTYYGGGTYRFWIAKHMTLATATFQGISYQVGGKYGRDIGFSPAVPADVTVTAKLFVNSSKTDVRSLSFSGKASPGGIYGTAQGAQQLTMDAPGEYVAHVFATYTDQEKHLWVCSMRHAGVVYPANSSIVAHGKKLTIGGKYVALGETHFEGYAATPGDSSHLAHITYPYNAGDVLLIASEQQGCNKIEPMLTYDNPASPINYEARLQNIGATNLQLITSNGYSPHLYPEYITDMAYFYAGAPRPGFMSRFIVGEDGIKTPYWPTSPNSFGGQINASANGDLPGTIYRLIGGVVRRPVGQTPSYAGYMASAFVMPGKTNNNRVIAAGTEDLLGSDGTRARLFLVGTRPGMTYETGTLFAPAVQIDPMLPANINFKLTYPDGRIVTWQGTGDATGSFAGATKSALDIPGVYNFQLFADWNGYPGRMPGLPLEGGKIFVIEKDRLPQAPTIKLVMPEQTVFNADGTLSVNGLTTATSVHWAAVMPGAVTSQGVIPVKNGKFSYTFDPGGIAQAIPTYDKLNMVSGKPEVKRVIHLTFFSEENMADGSVYHCFVRLIIRGTTVSYAY